VGIERLEHSDEDFLVDDPVTKGKNIDLRTLFDDSERELSSWEEYLRGMLSPYLDEYPFINGDVEVLRRLDEQLRVPVDINKLWSGFYGLAVFECPISIDDDELNVGEGLYDRVEKERDRQIREVLEQARHVSKNHSDKQVSPIS
jgi:hypothetical protein